MKSIKTFKSLLRESRNAEHYQFHYYAVEILEENSAEIAETKAAIAAYKALFKEEEVIYKYSAAQQGTPEIVELDAERDRLYIGFRMAVNAGAYSTDAETLAAAEGLKPLLKLYVGIEKKNYMANSGDLTNFIEDARKEPYAAQIEKLGLTASIAEIETANLAFMEAYKTRYLWVGEHQTRVGKMNEIRPQVDEAFGLVASIIASLYQVNDVGAKDPAVAERLGKLIDGINDTLDQLARVSNSHVSSGSDSGNGSGSGNGDGGEEKPDESMYMGMRQPVITSDGLMYIEAQNKPAFDEFVKEHFTLTAEGKGVMFIESLPGGTKQKYFYPFKSFEGDLDENMQPVTIGLNFSPREGYVFQSPFTEEILANPYVCYLYAATDKLVAVFPDEKKPREIKFNK